VSSFSAHSIEPNFRTYASYVKTGQGGTELDQSGPAHQVAEMAVRKATSRSLSQDGRVVGGVLVHYLFGAAVGGFYGGLGESWTWIRWGAGTLFGTGVFVAADELSLPALQLGNKPTDETLEAQTQHWLAHIAFGISTELGRRFFRSLLENDSDAREPPGPYRRSCSLGTVTGDPDDPLR